MVISFGPLWKTLDERGRMKMELREKAGMSKSTFAKLAKGESVTMETVARICEVLEVPIEQVVSIIPDSAGNGSDEG